VDAGESGKRLESENKIMRSAAVLLSVLFLVFVTVWWWAGFLRASGTLLVLVAIVFLYGRIRMRMQIHRNRN